MHLAGTVAGSCARRGRVCLRPGGVLVLEAYTPRQLGRGSGGPPLLELLVEPVQLERELQGLDLVICGTVCARSRKGATTRETAPWCRSWAGNHERC
jgi:hypothetical protein